MCSGQNIVIVVNGEGSRFPTGRRCMASTAVIRNVVGKVVRVGRLVVFGEVTAYTGVGCCIVVTLVTSLACY